jgi:histidinol-phosphatase (PHP family)
MAVAAASAGIAAEVSSAGYVKPAAEPYSPPALLHRFHRAGVPVTTASDAHRLAHVAHRTADLRALVVDAGYTALQAFEGRKARDVPI